MSRRGDQSRWITETPPNLQASPMLWQGHDLREVSGLSSPGESGTRGHLDESMKSHRKPRERINTSLVLHFVTEILLLCGGIETLEPHCFILISFRQWIQPGGLRRLESGLNRSEKAALSDAEILNKQWGEKRRRRNKNYSISNGWSRGDGLKIWLDQWRGFILY